MTKKSRLKALIVALCVALTLGIVPGCAKSEDTGPAEQVQDQVEVSTETGKLILALSVEGWESTNQGVPVTVSGTTVEGQKVDKLVTVVPGQPMDLDVASGSYDLSVDGAKISTDTIVYQTTTAHTDFKGKDLTVNLDMRQDAEATQELARKAEEEAAAKAQAEAEAAAEAQRQAEAEAAAKAQAEAEAAAEAQRQAEAQCQAEAAAAAAQRNEQTVYITNTGTKYHHSGCRHLKKSQIPISLSDAQAQGYTPCKNCF